MSCKGCHWEEDGYCYHGNPPLDENGHSNVEAEGICDNYWDDGGEDEFTINNIQIDGIEIPIDEDGITGWEISNE